MIGLDTNVLVRYIVRDDVDQAEAATRLIESRCTAKNPGFISIIVLSELSWVLSRGYKYDRRTVAKILSGILSVPELRVHEADVAWQALKHYEEGKADFADYLIGVSNQAHQANITYTFDKKAADGDLFELIS